MAQVTEDIPENNYGFFIELVNKLDFVNEVETKKESRKRKLQKNIADGIEEVKLFTKGKLKTSSAKAFLNEMLY